MLELGEIVAFQAARDGAAVGLSVEDVAFAIPRIHERAGLLGGNRNPDNEDEGARCNRQGQPDGPRRRRLAALYPNPLDVLGRDAVRSFLYLRGYRTLGDRTARRVERYCLAALGGDADDAFLRGLGCLTRINLGHLADGAGIQP